MYLCTILGKNLLTSIIFITFAKNFNAMNRIFVFLTATILCAGMVVGCSPKSNKPLHAGIVIRDTIQGTPCCVYLPQNYEARVAKNQEVFPVLYLQHGMYGIEDDWTTQGRLVEIMDSLLQSGEAKEMVVIMPDNCPHRPTADEERANAMSGEWEGHFPEFMAESEAKYRKTKCAHSWQTNRCTGSLSAARIFSMRMCPSTAVGWKPTTSNTPIMSPPEATLGTTGRTIFAAF